MIRSQVTVLVLFGTLTALTAPAALPQTAGARLPRLGWTTAPAESAVRLEVEIVRPAGIPPLRSYACVSYAQQVVERTRTSVRLHVAQLARQPRPDDPYPPVEMPESVRKYTAATPRIQSDSPAVDAAARRLIAAENPGTIAEAVEAVTGWVSKSMRYGFSREVPDALLCLKRRSGNCIGYSHLSAALLRRMGIPVRTVRLYALIGGRTTYTHAEGKPIVRYEPPEAGAGRLSPHTVIEVYYPQQKQWLLYEPQGRGIPPSPVCIYLYSDRDWSAPQQRIYRPVCSDPLTRITGRLAP